MKQVLAELHEYVPSHCAQDKVTVPNSDETIEVSRDSFDRILLSKSVISS